MYEFFQLNAKRTIAPPTGLSQRKQQTQTSLSGIQYLHPSYQLNKARENYLKYSKRSGYDSKCLWCKRIQVHFQKFYVGISRGAKELFPYASNI